MISRREALKTFGAAAAAPALRLNAGFQDTRDAVGSDRFAQPQQLEHRRAEGLRAARRRRLGADDEHAIGVGHRERTQVCGLKRGKDDTVGADAERQHQYREHRIEGMPARAA